MTFGDCKNLTTCILPKCSALDDFAFYCCYNLLSLYLLSTSYVSLSRDPFYETPISDNTTSTGGVYGSIYVPASMIETYKTMAYWSRYSSRFVAYDE